MGASTAFVGVFWDGHRGLERVRPPQPSNNPADLFAHGGSVGHLDAVDCRGNLVMISSAIAQGRGYLVRRRYGPQRIGRFEDFSAPPFLSC